MADTKKVVFISQSGPQSLFIARALRDMLVDLFPGFEFWVAADGIERGHNWLARLMERLSATEMGIFVLTPGNLENTWMHFEAGAVAKSDKSRVITLLHRVKKEQVGLPLNAFQMTLLTLEDVYPMFESINIGLGGIRTADSLKRAFDKFWPDFAAKVRNAPEEMVTVTIAEPDLLKETHNMVRELIDNSMGEHVFPRAMTIESLIQSGAGMADARSTVGGLELTLLRTLQHIPREEQRRLLRQLIGEAKKLEDLYATRLGQMQDEPARERAKRAVEQEEHGRDPNDGVVT